MRAPETNLSEPARVLSQDVRRTSDEDEATVASARRWCLLLLGCGASSLGIIHLQMGWKVDALGRHFLEKTPNYRI